MCPVVNDLISAQSDRKVFYGVVLGSVLFIADFFIVIKVLNKADGIDA